MLKSEIVTKYKNKIWLIILFIFIILIILLSYFIFKPITSWSDNNDLINFLQQNNKKDYILQFRLNNAVNSLKNDKIKETQYKNLVLLAYYTQDAYFKRNSPEIREYLSKLNDKIKNKYPKLYSEGDFLVTCADPECGDKPDAEELKLLENIKKFNVDQFYKNIISTNLKISIYIPYNTKDNKIEKINFFIQIYNQLLQLDNKQASKSAENYAIYIKNKYNYDVTNPNKLPPNL